MRQSSKIIALVGLLVLVAALGAATSDVTQTGFPSVLPLWESQALFPPGEYWRAMDIVAVGDVTGDGFDDLVAAHVNHLYLFICSGDGTFICQQDAFLSETDTGVVSIWSSDDEMFHVNGQIHDLDQDGDLDFCLVALPVSDDGSIWHTFRNDEGVFSLEETRVLPVRPSTFFLESHADSTRVAIVETPLQGPTTLWSMESLPDEHFDFAAPTVLTVLGESDWPFAYEDASADGISRIFFLTHESVFSIDLAPGFFRKHLYEATDDVRIGGAAFVDLDEDGVDELVVEGLNYLVVTSRSGSEYVETARYEEDVLYFIAVGDFNGDTHQDVLAEQWNSNWRIYYGDGTGELHVTSTNYLFPIKSVQMIPAQFNPDGATDLFLANPYTNLAVVSGAQPVGTTRLHMQGNALFDQGDVDGDGDIDLIGGALQGLEIFLNNGAGVLESSFSDEIYGLVAGAVGNTEILALESFGETYFLHVLDSSGVISATHDLGGRIAPLLRSGDLDGNGLLDIVMVRADSLIVLWDDGKLRFYPWTEGQLNLVDTMASDSSTDRICVVSTDEYADLYSIVFEERDIASTERLYRTGDTLPLALRHGDVDGDSVEDPVLISVRFKLEEQGGGRTNITTSGAAVEAVCSTLGAKVHEILGFPEGDTVWPFSGLAVADWNEDGFADIAYSLSSGSAGYLMTGLGDGTYSSPRDLLVGTGPLLSADLDGNGIDELAASTLGTGAYLWIEWNGGSR